MAISMSKGKNRGNAAVLGSNQYLKKGGKVKRMQGGGSARLQRKLEKEKQKQEIYNVQGYENKRDKSDAQSKRASDILGGGKTKYKNNTTISNDNVNTSSSSSRNTNANQNANQNSSSSSSSSNARGGAGGSSTVRATGGNDLSTNANRSSNVIGGAQNAAEQNSNSKNYRRQKGGLIKSKNKIMKTKKMQVGGINSNNRKSKSTDNSTRIDNSRKSQDVSSVRSNNVIGGSGNTNAEQNVNSKNDYSRNTRIDNSRRSQSQNMNSNNRSSSTNVRQSSSSNRSTTNNNRSNVGNRSSSTSQRVGGYKKGGLVKKQGGGAAIGVPVGGDPNSKVYRKKQREIKKYDKSQKSMIKKQYGGSSTFDISKPDTSKMKNITGTSENPMSKYKKSGPRTAGGVKLTKLSKKQDGGGIDFKKANDMFKKRSNPGGYNSENIKKTLPGVKPEGRPNKSKTPKSISSIPYKKKGGMTKSKK